MHMGCLGEEIDAHEISEQRNRCTWGVQAKKSMHMKFLNREIDAQGVSRRRNLNALGPQDQEINAQDPNLCIDIFSAFPKKNQCT